MMLTTSRFNIYNIRATYYFTNFNYFENIGRFNPLFTTKRNGVSLHYHIVK